MLGFVFGTICLLLLLRMACRRRWGWAGCGGWGGPWRRAAGHGHGCWTGEAGPWHGGWRGRPSAWARGGVGPLRWLFEELDTTPGQEKAIAAAAEDLRRAAAAAREELPRSRKDLAAALRAAAFDPEPLGQAFGRHDEALGGLRRAFLDALAKVHEVLDERQRARLAELLDSGAGPAFFHPFHPYR